MEVDEVEQEHTEHPWTTHKQAETIVKEHHAIAKQGYEGDLPYTRKKLRGQLLLVQEHSSDGSAYEGCECIPKKHMEMIHEYAAEGVPIASDQKEKEFYDWLTKWADYTHSHIENTLDANDDMREREMWMNLADDTREIRREIAPQGNFEIPNPASKRAYLPHGLTEQEKEDKHVRDLLSRCIKQTELSCCGGHTKDYGLCKCNPVAVCRKSVEK